MLFTLLTNALAADVLIPAVTPLTVEDVAISESFYRQVVSASLQAGLTVEDADGMRVWAGADAENCYDNTNCPQNLWSRTDARVAVVLRVGQGSNGLIVEARLNGYSDSAPLNIMRETVAPGKEASYAAKLALTVQEVLELLPPREQAPPPVVAPVVVPPQVVIIAPIENPSVEENPKVKPPTSVQVVVPTVQQPPQALTNHYHLPQVIFQSLVASGLNEKQWMANQRVRTGRFTLQVAGGMGLLDVGRSYSVEALNLAGGAQTQTVAQSSWEGSMPGAGFTGQVAIGYTPIWFLETSLTLGMVYGKKDLYVGWECYTTGGSACEMDTEGSNPSYARVFHSDGVQGIIEPKLRLLPVATGYVKPYAMAGLSVRIYDGFEVPTDLGADFQNTAGGAQIGPMVGGGIYVDALPDLSFFVEAPWVFLFPADGVLKVDPKVKNKLESNELPNPSGGYVRIVAGIEVNL